MAQFEEVLDKVRLLLTWASAAEVHGLLEGLVEERIISEAYSKSLSLHGLTDRIALEAGSDSRGLNWYQHLNQEQLGQVRKCGSNSAGSELVFSMDEQNSTNPQVSPLLEYQVIQDQISISAIQELMEGAGMDRHYLNQTFFSTTAASDYNCRINDEVARQMQKPVSDNERINQGNLEDGEEWLEQVEEAARRIAVPLWQHWDRGRRMLSPLVPCTTAGWSTSENTLTDGEAQSSAWDMNEEMELAAALRTLDKFTDSFSLDAEEASEAPQGLYASTHNCWTTTDDFDVFGAEGITSPVEACAATDTNNNLTDKLQSHLDVCWSEERTNAADDLFSLTVEAQYNAKCGLSDDSFMHLLTKDDQTVREDYSFFLSTGCSMAVGVTDDLENASKTGFGTTTDIHESMDSTRDAKMQEVDLFPMSPSDFGDLPDDLSEYLNDDLLDTDVLFGDPLLTCVDEHDYCSDKPTEVPGLDDLPQRKQPTDKQTKTRRKRQRAPRTDESTRAKRQKATGRTKATKVQAEQTTVVQEADAGSAPRPKDSLSGLSTTPPSRILHLYPSHSAPSIPIQIITIPDAAGYQVVQLSTPPPVIRLPLPNAATAPTYILVPATSPPCKRQLPPLSPVDGAVAPLQMSSSPPGSLSDTASKAMSFPCASPLSPSTDMSPCKESPPPQSPTVPDIPRVNDYIQEAKAHMSHACQDMETGLSLTSHYVDVKVSQREILRSGKNTNKCLDKELVIMGDTDRQKSLLGPSQIFGGSNGDKSKNYILLFGTAGSGKTTLIKKLCLDWSRDCISQFDFVFLLDGKQLSLAEPTFSLQTVLLNLSSFAPPCMDPEAVFAQILAAPKRVLIIFDGFQELREYEMLLQTQEKDLVTSLLKDNKAQTFTVKQLYSAVLQRVLLPGCTLLLSTRPRGSALQLLRRADSLLETCGFTPTHIATYLTQYFTDPALRASALDCLKSSSYLQLLCWNPGLCRLVCLVLEQSKSLEVLPRTLTGLCHQVLCLKMEKERGNPCVEAQTQTPVQVIQENNTQMSDSCQVKRCDRNNRTKSRKQLSGTSGSKRSRRAKKQRDEVDEDMKSDVEGVDRTERELLSQLSSLAWEGVKSNSSILPTGRTVPGKLKAFGLRTGLVLSHHLRKRPLVSNGENEGGGREDKHEMEEEKENRERTDTDLDDDHILLWANPFLQSYMAAVHLFLSRTVTDRNFLQTLPFQSGGKGRRRPQREELELAQRFMVGLPFHNITELQRLHLYSERTLRDVAVNRQALVIKHLEELSYGDLNSSQVLELCHCVYEASHINDDGSTGSTRLVTHLAANLPEFLTFHGVPLSPPDVFTVQNAVERGGAEGRSFCLDLEDSGIQICGLRALVGLDNINTFRACIADVVTLWEQLEQGGEAGLLQGAVSKFKIHPLKATQVCHVEHLEKLVKIHMQKRLSDSSSHSESILAEGVPAVQELHKLEFELGPEKGPLALPMLWGFLPGLPNLQHLDLENCKIGDKGAENLANALVSLCSLEILNLSQNCIGDVGVKKLTATLKDLPKLHVLSLYSNVISDEGAESLAAVLPHMASLTDLDVKYNKLTDVGAQSLGASLRNCSDMKTLRMWNQCIPYGVFERLQQQDSRIFWH
ncbi:MHC class II transactivator isoform X2 [Stegastes partitus]|uniref:MHC class II transactivator isoform X2 n=1 Tax=Stegastes partitus TaxID=144197 RepID=A0A9Y4N1B4_9TELE|nr:PREDICTED: MHC class II transactivator isoform X2 [Stegastes partitus]